MNTLVIRVYCS